MKISNLVLYEKTKVTPISSRVKWARWKLTGKVLRMDENTPAYTSLMFARKSEKEFKAIRDRPPVNLYETILKDLKERNLSIESDEDLESTKQWPKIKLNGTKWRKFIKMMLRNDFNCVIL